MNYKIPFALFLIFALYSCKKSDQDNTQVTSGIAQPQTRIQTILSHSCEGGSFTVSKTITTTVSQATTPTVLPPVTEELKVGDVVDISGTISNNLCAGGGALSFTCEARVVIDTNRAFTCDSGTVLGGASLVGSSTVPGVSSAGQSFSGQFHTFNNGTSSYVTLNLSPSATMPSCPVSFYCVN